MASVKKAVFVFKAEIKDSTQIIYGFIKSADIKVIDKIFKIFKTQDEPTALKAFTEILTALSFHSFVPLAPTTIPSVTNQPVPPPVVPVVDDVPALEEFKLLSSGIEADFEEAEENIIAWQKFTEEKRVEEYLTKLLTQVKIALRVISTPERITEPHAKKLIILWKCAIRKDVKDYFKMKQQGNSEVVPTFLPAEQKPKPPPKIQISKFSRFLCIMNTGGLVPYNEENSRTLFVAAEDKNLPDVELKIGDVDYKVSVKEMKQTNVKTGYQRQICAFKSWPDEGPPFWNTQLPKPLLPALQEDKASEFGALSFIVRAIEAHGRTIIGVKFNKNVKLWAQYCLYRKHIELTYPDQAQERIVWHGAPFLAARALINGTSRDFTVNHWYGKGVYTAVNAEYSLDPRYAKYYTGEIEGIGIDEKPVKVKNAQTLVACFITFGTVCKGTQDMMRPPPGITATVDSTENPEIIVGIDDHMICPFARVFVAGPQ